MMNGRLACSLILAGTIATLHAGEGQPLKTPAPLLYSAQATPIPAEFSKQAVVSPKALPHGGQLIQALARQDRQNVRIPGPVKAAFDQFIQDIQSGDRVTYFYDGSGHVPVPEALQSHQYSGFSNSELWRGPHEAPSSQQFNARYQDPAARQLDALPTFPGGRVVQGLCIVRNGQLVAAVVTSTCLLPQRR